MFSRMVFCIYTSGFHIFPLTGSIGVKIAKYLKSLKQKQLQKPVKLWGAKCYLAYFADKSYFCLTMVYFVDKM